MEKRSRNTLIIIIIIIIITGQLSTVITGQLSTVITGQLSTLVITVSLSSIQRCNEFMGQVSV